MSRLVMHVDLDAFYAAVEQRDRPEWRGRPLVVGAEPGRRGVVATCSYEARRFGVRSAMPIAEAVRRLPADAVYVRPDMSRYVRVSQEIMGVLSRISPAVEPVSVDEAYLDVSGLERLMGPPEVVGRRTKAAILDAVGLTASVGIGPNRLVAKLASEARKPDGLLTVRPEQVQSFLDPLPVSALRGVGATTLARLERAGVHRVGELRARPLIDLRQLLGPRLGAALHLQGQGIADDRVYPVHERQSISKETTFAEDLTDRDVLRDTLRWAAQEVGFIARREGLRGTVVTLKVRWRPFDTRTRSKTLAAPTADDRVIFATAWDLLQAQGNRGRAVRLIGLGLSGWVQTPQQLDLFAETIPESARPTGERLDTALDAIRRKFGRQAIQRGIHRRG